MLPILDLHHQSPWSIYLQQVDRVTPYLGNLSRSVERLKRPRRALIVDVRIGPGDSLAVLSGLAARMDELIKQGHGAKDLAALSIDSIKAP